MRQITIESRRTIHHDLNQSAVTCSRNDDDVIKAGVTNAGVERERRLVTLCVRACVQGCNGRKTYPNWLRGRSVFRIG